MLIPAIVVCALLIVGSFFAVRYLHPVKAVAEYTVIPLQRGLDGIGRWFSRQLDDTKSLEQLEAENVSLQAEVDTLTMRNQALATEHAELERLQELFSFSQEYPDYPMVGARVIGKESGNWFHEFIIDKGSDDAIAADMNVIAPGGLVGIVVETGKHWSRVRSIIDDESHVSSMTANNADICLVDGDLTLMDEGRIKFSHMANNDNEVHVGDVVVTSNISSKFMPNITVGYIAEIQVDANNLTRSGYIIPSVSFDRLQEVLVITQIKENVTDTDEVDTAVSPQPNETEEEEELD